MKTLSERITDRVKEQICKVCIYETAGGGCGLRADLDCPILSRVSQIVDVVKDVDEEHIGPYVDKLRTVVCSDCHMENDAGHCSMREHADCALDDYFTLIVQIVEEELERGKA